MRHRARRPLISRLLLLGPVVRRALAHLTSVAAGRRAAVAAAALVVAGATVGVAIAMTQGGSDPVTSAVPPMVDTGTSAASGATPSADHPSKRVSRSGDRKALGPGTTRPPSPTGPASGPATDESLGSAAASGSAGSSSPQPSGSGATSSRPQQSDTASPSKSASGSPSKSATASPDPTPDPSPEPPADTVAPETTATTTAVEGRSWTVALGANEPAGFACSLDGGAFAPCAATAVFSGLSGGTHTLAARATDLAGNTDPTPVQLTVKVHGPA